MNDTIKVICENGFGELEVPMGTPLLEVAERLTPGFTPSSQPSSTTASRS